MKQYAKTKYKDKQIFSIICSSPGCGAVYSEQFTKITKKSYIS